ncbi:MAG: 23S rRNA (guanosine(2251)-2'-O)-methyltransferase RlmB [Gammaproteobacteria bacterium]|nr:MAG: 23S rRNA (guanosine(2251)-2'-O)-methyltransferase RlmB [Gammaproteobacteria bacterium]
MNQKPERKTSGRSAETACGIHAVSALLSARPQDIYKLWVVSDKRNARVDELVSQARDLGLVIAETDRQRLDRLGGELRHQGIIAEASPAPVRNEQDLAAATSNLDQPFYLILDGVEDPHNLGACLRVADGAGVHGVIVPRDHASPVTPLVRRVAAGAAESVPVYRVGNLARAIQQLQKQGVWVIGASDKAGQSLYQTDLRGPLALVLGAEQKGLRKRTEALCDALVSLPMAGQVSSLNVSVAAGISLYEAVRQRQGETT